MDTLGPSFKWTCTVCVPYFTIERYTQANLDLSVSVHIREHERRAESKGREQAELYMPPGVSIPFRPWNERMDWDNKLTVEDQKFLQHLYRLTDRPKEG
jgi:hypothetical protein